MLKDLLQGLSVTAEDVGLLEIETEEVFYSVKNGKFQGAVQSHNKGYLVEVIADGHIAYAATPDGTFTGVQKAAHKALELAKLMQRFSLMVFDPKVVRFPQQGHYQTAKKSLSQKSAVGVEALCDLTHHMKAENGIATAQGNLWKRTRRMSKVSRQGTDIFQEHFFTGYDLSATAAFQEVYQTRTAGMPFLQRGDDLIGFDQLQDEANRLVEESRALAAAPLCPTGEMDLVLDAHQMVLQVHESIGHPLELDRILGDERNYAGWSFVRPSDFGTLQYGTNLLNVVFDPTGAHDVASYAFDDAGTAATKEFLIKEGRLVRGLGGIESQVRACVLGVANSRVSDWNRAPIDRMGNINMCAGDSSFEEMIAGIDTGIYMQTNRSWSIDDYRQKFQFGCEYATLIKNGKLAGVVRNPNYKSETLSFWHALKAVGNEETVRVGGSPYCGKGEPNQLVFVGHTTPACAFSNISVFGGA